MPIPMTSDQLASIRTDGQASKVYAAFFIPPVVYTAVLATVPSSTDKVAQITFSSGSGTLANVKTSMSLYVGSAAGKNDLGICRIRLVPIAGTFYIGEQSKINWGAVTPVYLTVVEDYDLNPKHIYIESNGTIKMDRDIAYSNQHSLFNPVPVLGSIVRVKKKTGASVVVQMGSESGYDSWVFDSTITTYLWACATASAISNTAIARPTMTFTATGWHIAYCTVTAANGKSKRGVRFIYIWNDSALPLTRFTLGSLTENYDSGGSSFSLDFATQATSADIPDRALCVLFAEDYAGTEQTLVELGHVPDAKNILAIGRVISSAQVFDKESGSAHFEIAGYQELFKKITGFPNGLRMKNTPALWIDMPALTVDRGLWHFLEWRTTASEIMDIVLTGDTRYTTEVKSTASTLWSQMEQIAFAQTLANIHVDHLGRLFVETDPLLIPEASRTYPVILTLENRDIVGTIEMDLQALGQIGQVDLSGLAVTLGGSASAKFALSPGTIMERTGGIEIVDHLLLTDIAQARTLAGLIFSARNNPYPKITIQLNGNNRMITCFPNQGVRYTLDGNIAPRGIGFDMKLIPRRRMVSYDAENGVLETTIEFENETAAAVAIEKIVPGSGNLSTAPEPPNYPPLPDYNFVIPGSASDEPGAAWSRWLVKDETAGLLYTKNLSDDQPDWFQVNGGLTLTQYRSINEVHQTPSGAVYVLCYGAAHATTAFLARAPSIGATFVIVEDYASISARYGGSTDNIKMSALGINPLTADTVVYVLTMGGENCKSFLGVNGVFTAKLTFTLNTNITPSLTYSLGNWVFTSTGYRLLFSKDFGTLISTLFIYNYNCNIQARKFTSASLYFYGFGGLLYSTNNLTTFSTVQTAGYNKPFFIDPTSLTVLTFDNANAMKSTDGGYSFSNISFLPVLQVWAFGYSGGSGTTSKWLGVSSGGYIYYSENLFSSAPLDKRGNLFQISSIANLTIVKKML